MATGVESLSELVDRVSHFFIEEGVRNLTGKEQR